MAIFAEITKSKCVKERGTSCQKRQFDQYCAITGKRFEIGRILFTNRKLHTGFRLVPKSVTLNDLERRNDRQPALSLR